MPYKSNDTVRIRSDIKENHKETVSHRIGWVPGMEEFAGQEAAILVRHSNLNFECYKLVDHNGKALGGNGGGWWWSPEWFVPIEAEVIVEDYDPDDRFSILED
jgi:hypothetical protein